MNYAIKGTDQTLRGPNPTKARKIRTFVSYIGFVYSLPDMIEIDLPPSGELGFLEDAKNIQSYFQKALQSLNDR